MAAGTVPGEIQKMHRSKRIIALLFAIMAAPTFAGASITYTVGQQIGTVGNAVTGTITTD
jgi:hypothetical protein